MANKKSNKGHSKNAGNRKKNRANSSGSKGGSFENPGAEGFQHEKKRKK